MRRAAAIPASALFALAALTPGVLAQDEEMAPATQMSTSAVLWFPTMPWGGQPIAGATSSYVAYEEGISATLDTSGLMPGHAVTLWWVVFNHPELCSHGEGGLRCGEGDLLLFGGDPAIEGTVLHAAGHVIGPDGKGTFGAYLAPADTSRVVGEGPGLTNPLGADVHLVVRDHGPVQPGLLADALSTFGGGCSDAPEGTGAPGDFACADLQFAFHEPTLGE